MSPEKKQFHISVKHHFSSSNGYITSWITSLFSSSILSLPQTSTTCGKKTECFISKESFYAGDLCDLLPGSRRVAAPPITCFLHTGPFWSDSLWDFAIQPKTAFFSWNKFSMQIYTCEKKKHMNHYGYPQPFIFSQQSLGSTNVPICLGNSSDVRLGFGNFHEEIARPTRQKFSKWYQAIFVGTTC